MLTVAGVLGGREGNVRVAATAASVGLRSVYVGVSMCSRVV